MCGNIEVNIFYIFRSWERVKLKSKRQTGRGKSRKPAGNLFFRSFESKASSFANDSGLADTSIPPFVKDFKVSAMFWCLVHKHVFLLIKLVGKKIKVIEKEKKKYVTRIVEIEKDRQNFIDFLADQTAEFKGHVNRIYKQYEEIKRLKENLPNLKI
jgi:hypothetical protein